MNEQQRILVAYQRRHDRDRSGEGFYTFEDLAHLFRIQERHRETLWLLSEIGFHPLTKLRILDIGCGDGNMLRNFVEWGALPEQMAGIELRADPVERGKQLNPSIDIRCGSATDLPWPENAFDLVCQHTVFTSVLDLQMKKQLAVEMRRVLRPSGAVLWYDFMYDNPRNSDVRGIRPSEIETLFPDFESHMRRITLAPPIARRLPKRLLPVLYPLLASVPFLRTHYLGLLIKPK